MSEDHQNNDENMECRLQEFLNGIEQFKDMNKLYSLFLAYNFGTDEEHLYLFWCEVVHNLFFNVIKSCSYTPKEIVNSFAIKGIKPAGLLNILQEMVNRNELVFKETLLKENYLTEETWSSKLMDLFKPQKILFDENKALIDLKYRQINNLN